jgi:hypothetical protein
MGVKILKFADERYAEREQKALKEEVSVRPPLTQ